MKSISLFIAMVFLLSCEEKEQENVVFDEAENDVVTRPLCTILEQEHRLFCCPPQTVLLGKQGESFFCLPPDLKEFRQYGPAINWYSNGNKNRESFYIDGLRHGIEKWWYENGMPGSMIEYHYGMQHGYAIYYYDNGYVRMEGKKKFGYKCGTWSCWSRNGTPHRCNFSSDDNPKYTDTGADFVPCYLGFINRIFRWFELERTLRVFF